MNSSDQYQALVKELLSWQAEIAEKDRTAKKVPCYEEYPPIREFKEITLSDKPALQKLQKIATKPTNKSGTKEKVDLPLKETKDKEKRKLEAIGEKDRGNEHFKKGEYEQAIQYYSRSIELDPLNAVFPINRAMAYLKLQRYPEAEKDCTLGLGIDPNNLKALWRRGIARRHMAKLSEAKQDLEKALKIEASNQAVKNELRLTTEALKSQKKPNDPPKTKAPRRRLEIEEIDADDDDMITPLNTKYTPRKEASPTTEAPHEQKPEIKSAIQAPALKPEPIKPTPPPTVVHAVDTPPREAEKPMPQFVPPKTTLEFERQWKTYRNDSDKLYHYFKCIAPANYSAIFKSSLESSYMTKIIELLKTYYIKSEPPSLIVEVLKNLSQVKRFDMIMMFMSSADKKTLEEVFRFLAEPAHAITPEDLRPLIKAYKVNVPLE
ncbi:hypothetical protein K493DRAFT_410187 [Basidiobolus meristosporus CBS 931.73]|uniref:RNA polymerase II-associated protein 3 n=1 Tax=Basidiobolus meristosporus CBS 931.73 TaxID=1314790 RepID=A0A1Y1XVT1_9FUNG|nr:hypothetical protein K493DRAFT_410187 [Basidiobolus meristosporus CBS 931.73]|eukprot:ORX89872.1 hypothetical protein K493DRAFT_410187 [Basidiobolus meristosporus CBS 931.73]